MIPTLKDAYQTLITRPMRSPGIVRSMYESRPVKKIADPAPPAPRNTTRSVKVGATAASAVVTPTTIAPSVTARRSPRRPMITPVNGSTASRVIEKAAMSTPTESSPTPKSRAYSGRMGARIPKPTMMMNVPAIEVRTSGMRRMSWNRSSPSALTPAVYGASTGHLRTGGRSGSMEP